MVLFGERAIQCEAAKAPAGTSVILCPILPAALLLGRAPDPNYPNVTASYTGLFTENWYYKCGFELILFKRKACY